MSTVQDYMAFGQGNIDTLISIENVTGTNFNDSLVGDGGNNFLQGAGGVDFLDGGAGNDILNGGAGNETNIKGNIGNDVLIGGSGADRLEGGADADTFQYFSTTDSGVGSLRRDVIADFQHCIDKLVFSTTPITQHSFSSSAPFVVIGGSYNGTNSGVASGPALVYDSAGHLSYDDDVSVAGYPQVAQLAPGTPLTQADIHYAA